MAAGEGRSNVRLYSIRLSASTFVLYQAAGQMRVLSTLLVLRWSDGAVIVVRAWIYRVLLICLRKQEAPGNGTLFPGKARNTALMEYYRNVEGVLLPASLIRETAYEGGQQTSISPQAHPAESAGSTVAAHTYPLQLPSVNTAVSTDQQDELDVALSFPTDQICSRSLWKIILNDYLQLVYPLIPVVHRPTFRQDVASDRDLWDQDFLGLTIALAVIVVSLVPTKFDAYRSHVDPIRFDTRKDMVHYCYDLLMRMRNSDYFDQISFQKWATSYLLAISFFQIGDLNRSRMVEVEAMQLGRLLHFHKISEYEGLNCIETQLRKKGFWLLFYIYVHSQLQNLRRERLTYLDPGILESLNLDDLLPIDADDEMISDNEILIPETDTPQLCTGFVIHCKVFWAALKPSTPGPESGSANMDCQCIVKKNNRARIDYIHGRLQDLRYLLDNVPPYLRQWSHTDTNHGLEDGKERLLSQFATLRANIHVTHLWLQSILMDQLVAALSEEDAACSDLNVLTQTRQKLWAEREELCRQLLHVLHGIPQAEIEPNGLHLAYKVRDVAVGLLTCPYGPQEKASRRAAQYVEQFTALLSHLDRSETVNTASLQSWVDTDRVRGLSKGPDSELGLSSTWG